MIKYRNIIGGSILRNKILIILLVVSLSVNLYMFGKWYLFDQWYEPTPDEKIFLSEMVAKTVKEYPWIAEREDVLSIDTSINKNKGGVYPYYMSVIVLTHKEKYEFSCKDEQCSEMVRR